MALNLYWVWVSKAIKYTLVVHFISSDSTIKLRDSYLISTLLISSWLCNWSCLSVCVFVYSITVSKISQKLIYGFVQNLQQTMLTCNLENVQFWCRSRSRRL